ncbi:hypothetical protein FDJ44_gp48 [Microbacterium phage Pikmin]|uniref:Uncharacterized protein n=3 Tax=Pikminvirus pikmin TaxID=2560596 RepID=A0A2P1CKQ0_9CAUD|nr:hypothetical protein FDJ44_gp48 [Microbacterium phage Pikmin]AVJ51039.1 hypothetical protein PBI_PAJAZA_48 [Microbacterium phage Pajaza]AVJ51186.1 hypothetical protein PBI_PIKMIN_48 [Microbacterium phage Pikmin]AVJ51744.1 hypothetical protein PBI_CASEY_48 [Microbacterium phage Casey]
MNPWHWVGLATGWAVLAILIILFLVIVFALVAGVVRKVQAEAKKAKAAKEAEAVDPIAMRKEARALATDVFKDEIVFQEEQIRAFVAGVDWARGYLSRQK